MATRAILASISASLLAIHDLGPHPNGMWASGCLLAFSSLVNLSTVWTYSILIDWQIIMYLPFRSKHWWFGPNIRWMVYWHYRYYNCTALWKNITIYVYSLCSVTINAVYRIRIKASLWFSQNHWSYKGSGAYILIASCMTISAYDRLWLASYREASWSESKTKQHRPSMKAIMQSPLTGFLS